MTRTLAFRAWLEVSRAARLAERVNHKQIARSDAILSQEEIGELRNKSSSFLKAFLADAEARRSKIYESDAQIGKALR